MTDHHKTIPIKTVQGLNALRALFGDEEQAIVIMVNETEQFVNYEVRPLADVVADLVLNGFGEITQLTS